ncbi:MAG TPA: DUF2202 domain-containing protein [Jiangellales bacterium]|nr:DUF2202 domain-containing protein [Jiangellales bacterium]
MDAKKRFLVIAITVGAVGLGVAVPAVAGLGPFGRPGSTAAGPGPGWDDGAGAGPNTMDRNGMGQNGAGMSCAKGTGEQARDGSCLDGSGLPAQGELTVQQEATLIAMAAEEKLAHDLYGAFAAEYDAVIFDRIALAETQHLTIVRALLARYGLTDPTADLADSQFGDPTVQATYDRLLAQGQASLTAALQVGRTVEQTDINHLRAALDGLDAPDVTQVYQNLLRASQHHLAAFERWS